MKLAVRHFVFGMLVSMCFAGAASAQYMKITTDNPADNTRMRASGTTVLTITLDTDHDKNTLLQTCNSHTSANCGAPTTAQPLDMFSYTIALKAVGGTVTWGTFSAADANYTDTSPQIQSDIEVEINKSRPTGTFSTPGVNVLGTLPVTPASGAPGIQVEIGASVLNPFGFGTGFGTSCDAFFFGNTYVVGDPADPCGTSNGIAGDWFDWDGALSASGNTPPTITAPSTASGSENSAITPIVANATDPEGAQTLTISAGTLPSFLSLTTTPKVSPNTGTVSGTPGFSDAGIYNINWSVTDGTDTGHATTVLTIANTDRPPVLTQPANMTVNEGATAEQTITGSDPDGDPLSFLLVSGPPFMSVLTDTPTSGTIRLLPNFTQSGTSSATVRASDGTAFDDKSLTITVNNVDRAPVLAQPNAMSLNAGTTADQSITATDADNDPLTFTKAAGPTFMTVTTTTPGTGSATGNIHLAPGLGDAGTYSATVTASDGSLNNSKSFSITVNAGANQPPTLTQPANMTVNEGATADQVLTGSDPDANPLTFSKVSGPTYVTVTTTNATSGNIHLAPGFSDAGTASATVRADDGNGGTNDKSLTITVNNVNRAPVLTQPANMSVAQGATADQVITGSDPDGDALTFTKISGPTFMTVTTTNATTGNIHLAAGVSEPVGTSLATVQAADATLNNQKSLTITVTATNHAPVLAQPSNMTVNEGATADQTLNATDQDGNALTFSLISGPTYATVTTTTPGAGTATGNIHLAPGFSDAGTASATVQASDGSLNNQKSLTITVNNTNRAPTLDAITNMSVTQGATADQVITASDPDGDPLTFTQISGPTFMTVTTTNPTTGNIHLAPGALEPTGVTAASVRAADGALFSNVQPFTVTVNPAVVNNNPPVLTQPSNMTVNENATADQSLTATDQDGNPLSFSKVAGPTFMTVTTVTPGTGTGTGTIHLAPGFSDAGTSSATVRADDGNGGTDDKSLTITVNNTNRPPVLNAILPMTVVENSTSDQSISGTDPDGDALTFSKNTGATFVTITTTTPTTGNVHLAPGIGDAGVYTVQALVSDGSLTDTEIFQVTVDPFVASNNPPVLTQPSDMTVAEGATADQSITATDPDGDPLSFSKVSGPGFMTVTTVTAGTGTGTGTIHLAPGFSDAGTYAATVRADDGKGGMNDKSLTITVTNVNRAPTLDAITDMTVIEGATADQTITGSDPDGDALTFSKASGPGFMTIVPMSATSANIHLAPGAGTAGTYSASATASDGSLSDTKSFTITVNPAQGGNNPPVLTQPDNMTVDEGQTADQTLNATDPDGDPLSFTKVGGPTFMTVGTTSPTTGNVHLAPGFADAGTYTGTVRAADGKGGTDDKSFMITVNNVNRPPVADAGGPYTGIVNVGLSFNGSGSTDPDGDALTYSWDFDATDGITTDATGATPSHTYTAAGTYTVTLTVSDGTLSDDDTATATISESGGFQADASVEGGDRVIRLQANRPFWCVSITPVDGSFQISDIIPTSVQLTYNGSSIPSIGRRIVEDDEGGHHSAELCFAKDQLRTLFAGLSNGRHDVTVTITGDLQGGGSFVASLDITVQKTGGPNGAAKHGINGEDAFVWASPNPLNPSTVISFALSQPGSVRLNVYDISGRLVKALVNQFMGAGVHDVRWDGSTRTGTRVASGVYFYVLQTPERTVKSQLVVAK